MRAKEKCSENIHRWQILEVGFVFAEVTKWDGGESDFIYAASARRMCLKCGKTERSQVGIPKDDINNALSIYLQRFKEVEADWHETVDNPPMTAFTIGGPNAFPPPIKV